MLSFFKRGEGRVVVLVLVQIGPKWSAMVRNYLKGSEMVQKLFKMVQNDPKWSKSVQKCP